MSRTKYETKTPREHVLLRPEMYIGGMSLITRKIFIPWEKKYIEKEYSPAFIKIFDEIITNAIDHSIKNKDVTYIKTNVNKTNISVTNDGPPIPLDIQDGKYIPEIIFGNLFSSSNYNDEDERVWAGLNGIGAKATNIFSKQFIVEIVNKGKKYVQVFKNNMSEIGVPSIEDTNENDYTKITYTPDLKKFNINSIDTDMIMRRIYQASAITSTGVSFYFNNKKVKCNSLVDYYGINSIIHIKNKNWDIYVEKNENNEGITHSYVNGIPTELGGTHVNHVVNKVIKLIKDKFESRNKTKKINVRTSDIKKYLNFYISCTVNNPRFSSQSKEELVSTNFYAIPNITDSNIVKIIKEIEEDIISLDEFRNRKKINDKISTTRTSLRIPKLDDAHYAGTKKSNLCSLILTEGDSAKTSVLSGLSKKDKEYIGIYPLRGKSLNVQKATKSQLESNEEILNIMKILGLKKGNIYTDTNSLRYGKLYIVSDQDYDGFHIKGLVINFFKSWFPSLLKLEFIRTIKTPIVKVGNHSFYNLSDFEEYKKNHSVNNAKYKKGLASLTKQDSKECFGNIDNTEVLYKYDENSLVDIDIPFSKSVTNRKDWISDYDKNIVLDYNTNTFSYSDFVHKELKHFSNYDNIRSIPSLVDGLKPSQRKILYACLKRNLYSSIRVSQLAGYVSEVSEYHHGEASLNDTIISMAQNFVGSNNINLLFPEDQFGSRIQGGKDSGSPRYIHTRLEEIVKHIFIKEDEPVLTYNVGDEGNLIEPEYYVPIIPMILVNGSKGIGSGFSTEVLCYNPLNIIENIYRFLDGKALKKMIPWYRGHKGDKETINKKLISYGSYTIEGNKVIVTELPVKIWNENYKQFLHDLEDKKVIKNFKDKCTESEIHYEITLGNNVDMNRLYEILGLVNTLSLNNLTLYDENGKIKKYDDVNNILTSYIRIRLEYYEKRKEYLIKTITELIKKLENKMRFIDYYINDKIKIHKVSNKEIKEQFEKHNFINHDELLNINLRSLTNEKYKELKNTIEREKKKLEELQLSTPEIMWKKELEKLETILKNEKY